MSITDELREWAKGSTLSSWTAEHLTAIADRIDAEHEKALSEAYTKGCEDGMGVANAKDAQAEYLRGKNDGYDEGWDAGFASADDWLGQHEDTMAKHGWVRLPKDADGEYIRVGERVQLIGNDPSTVSHMSLADDGWRVYVKYDGGIGIGSGEPKRIRHHHAPTVEDVLREFAGKWLAVQPCREPEIIAEYASKLRLAEGEDA